MAAEQYESQKYTASMFAIRKAMATLREHFESVEISCSYTDSSGVDIVCEQSWSEDSDDEDKKAGN